MTLASHIIKQLQEHEPHWDPLEQCWYGDGTLSYVGRIANLGEHGFGWKVFDTYYASRVEVLLQQGEALTKNDAKRAAWNHITELVKARYA